MDDENVASGEADTTDQAAFMSALVTEHFVLQSAASTTVSEAASRASLFMLTLSSSLITLGFVSQTETLLVPFVAALVPAILILGVFSVVRLVDTGVQNVELLSRIAAIRAYYRTLGPQAPAMFGSFGGAGVSGTGEALASLSLRRGWVLGFFTTASMVAAVNSLVAGVGVALGWVWISGVTQPFAALAFGLVAAAGSMAAFLAYQDRRYKALEARLR